MRLSPFPRTVNFDKWAAEEERRGTFCGWHPEPQALVTPEGRRPRLFAAHSTCRWRKFASARRVLRPVLQLAAHLVPITRRLIFATGSAA
jgi:hypothetical protein